MERDGNLLVRAPRCFQDDMDVVKLVVRTCPTAIRHASHRLQSHPHIQLLSIVEANRSHTLRFCGAQDTPPSLATCISLPPFEPYWLFLDRLVLAEMNAFSIEMLIRERVGKSVDTSAACALKKVRSYCSSLSTSDHFVLITR